MSNPLQMLEDGILAKDIDLISKAFTALTGRTLEAEIAPAPAPVGKTSKKKTTAKKQAKPGKAAQSVPETPKVSTSVSAQGRKPILPFNDLIDPDEIKQNKKAAKAREKMRAIDGPRPKYVPHIVTCETCKASFDQHKVYPAGMFDASQRLLCENCQITNRPGR